jgi:hypothetical protein
MTVKRSVSGFCPHQNKNYIVAVWFREVKRADGLKMHEKLDFECNIGYRTACPNINSCPIYNDASYSAR